MSHVEQSCAANGAVGSLGSSARGGWRRWLLARMLPAIASGRLRVMLPDGDMLDIAGREPGIEATIVINRWRAFRRLALGGDVGFAESYVDGDWTTGDLSSLIRLAARNSAQLGAATRGARLVRLANQWHHRRNANSRAGSRRNIMAHYDLGNHFYRSWLDETMLYSSALFAESGDTLETAQARRLDRIRDLLVLGGGESVLEIGCGWGRLVGHLADGGAGRVTGITISPAQLAWAREEITRRGLDARVELALQDYRDVEGSFDRVVSIEMFEAVGETYWPVYFETLARTTKPGGRALLQVITIAEDRYEAYRATPDFIQKHIFPGGFLPSRSALAAAAKRAGLRITAAEHFGASYALTLAEWRHRFHASWDEISRLGFDDRFRRLWDYYLCYCEAGFRECAVDVGLYTLEHRSPDETVTEGRAQ